MRYASLENGLNMDRFTQCFLAKSRQNDIECIDRAVVIPAKNPNHPGKENRMSNTFSLSRITPPRRISFGLAAVACVVCYSSSLFAQDVAQIELQDQAGQTLTVIDLLNGSSVTIDPLTGDLTAIPADATVCSGSGDCDATVEIESFTIDPTSVTQGGSFTAIFDERGAFECSRSGLPGTSWDGAFQDPDANVINVSVPSTVATGDYDLVLTCRNGTASPTALAALARTISVTEPDASIPQECIDQNRLAPSSWQRELNPLPLSTSTEVFTWKQFFGTDFPGGAANDMRVRPNRYLALKFDTGVSSSAGRVSFSDLSGNITGVLTRPALASMSACPGDFTPQQDADCRLVSVGGINPSFQWTRTGSTQFKCEIPANTEYYFNVSYVSIATEDSADPNDLVWECDPDAPDTACGHGLQHISN